MRLPWVKETKTKIEYVKETIIEYVPVLGEYNKSHKEKWSEDSYLRQVRGFANNAVFNSEILQALKTLREIADNAKTPEELKGCNAGIACIKSILTAPARADFSLSQAKERKEFEKQCEGDNPGVASR